MMKKDILNGTQYDAIVVKKASDIYYLTNIKINEMEQEGYLIVENNKLTIITDGRYEQEVLKTNPNINLIIITRGTSYMSNLLDYLKENKIINIGINFNNFSINEKKSLDGISSKYYDEKKLLSNLRRVKTEQEKMIIEEAYEITNNLWNHIKNFIKKGMKESDIVLEMYNYIISHGGTGFSFNPIIASGINSTKPHASWTNKVIEDGDIMTLDFGIKYKNYCTDVTKNVAIGNVDKELLEIFEICLEANNMAEKLIKDGFSIKELDDITRSYISSKGYGDYYNHGLGHGVGLDVHENPSLGKNDDYLEENELITIEPGIYLPNIGGIRVESAGFVTRNGFKSLTNSKELIKIS